MATYYGVKGSSNWTSGNWSTTATKDASRTGSGVTPTASDDCILDDWTSDGGGVTWTINASNCACKTLTCTGYAGTLTFSSSSQRLAVSGNVTLASGMTFSGAGHLRMSASATLTSAGLTIPADFEWNAAGTLTLADAMTVGAEFSALGALTLAGTSDITCDTFNASYNVTIPAGRTITVTTALNLSGVSGTSTYLKPTWASGTASSAAYLHYNGTAANCNVSSVTFTDITCAHAIDNWNGGTLTRTTGITNRTSADIGGGTGGVTGRCQQLGFGVC